LVTARANGRGNEPGVTKRPTEMSGIGYALSRLARATFYICGLRFRSHSFRAFNMRAKGSILFSRNLDYLFASVLSFNFIRVGW
jgi:hypothetical protein